MGRIGLTAKGNQVLAVVSLPLEPYLEGVVAKEMTTAFELPALQAQAVAARSYAYSLLQSSAHKPWDVTSSVATQAYGGADAANVLTRLAVATTRGEMISYDGRPVQAFFHSHSGGALEDDRRSLELGPALLPSPPRTPTPWPTATASGDSASQARNWPPPCANTAITWARSPLSAP